MKRLKLMAIFSGIVLVTGCATGMTGSMSSQQTPGPAAHPAPAAHSAALPPGSLRIEDSAGPVIVQKVEFRSGISSATVERLGRRFGCVGRKGAGLVTEKGPVEVYRMQCDDGTTFLAQCELRQCRPMR